MRRQGDGVFVAERDKRLTITDTVEANTPYEARKILAERHNVRHNDVVSPTQIDEKGEPISLTDLVLKGCFGFVAIIFSFIAVLSVIGFILYFL